MNENNPERERHGIQETQKNSYTKESNRSKLGEEHIDSARVAMSERLTKLEIVIKTFFLSERKERREKVKR